VFTRHYKLLLSLFDYYCVISNQMGRGAFSIQQNSYNKMCQDAGLIDRVCTVEECGKIFVAVNFETDKASADAEANEDRALMRFELLEALLRIAVRKYEVTPMTIAGATGRLSLGQAAVAVVATIATPAALVQKLITECIQACSPPEALQDADAFRDARLYCAACENVFKEHHKILQLVFKRYR
jgi:hypothetical protein